MEQLPSSPPPEDSGTIIDQLQKLNNLKNEGVISDEVFNDQKEVLIKLLQSEKQEIHFNSGITEKSVSRSSESTTIVLGYIFAGLCFLLLPIIFMPLAIIFCIILISKGISGHGIIIIFLAIVLALIGVYNGAGWGLGIGQYF